MTEVTHLFRTLKMFLSRPWSKCLTVESRFVTRFRVMPWDCDLNLHLTNSRYPVWLDLARTEFFLGIGAGKLFTHKGWRSVLASQTITFVREIKPLAEVELESRVLHWDRKYFYMEHRFVVDGRLHAKTLARIAILRGGRVRSLGRMLEAIAEFHRRPDSIPEPPPPPAEVLAKIELLTAKRQAEEFRPGS